MKEKISIIVPIYNVELYLERCVESIINQTYKNLEIILVDDGSPDNCFAICDKYEKLDSRVKVIHKENGGLSDARNAGLDIAEGEFIVFVDSDDWLEQNALELLYEHVKGFNSDITMFKFKYFDESTYNSNEKSPVKSIVPRWELSIGNFEEGKTYKFRSDESPIRKEINNGRKFGFSLGNDLEILEIYKEFEISLVIYPH